MSNVVGWLLSQFWSTWAKLMHIISNLDFGQWMIVLTITVVLGFLMLKSNLNSIKP